MDGSSPSGRGRAGWLMGPKIDALKMLLAESPGLLWDLEMIRVLELIWRGSR